METPKASSKLNFESTLKVKTPVKQVLNSDLKPLPSLKLRIPKKAPKRLSRADNPEDAIKLKYGSLQSLRWI